MKKRFHNLSAALRKVTAVTLALGISVMSPAGAFAQEATPQATPVALQESTVVCEGTSCTQGMNQGFDQGFEQGTQNGVTSTNSNTGADSTNESTVDTTTSTTTTVDNESDLLTDVDALGNTGGNTSNMNSGGTAVSTGDANLGVTQVVNDNSTAIGGTAGLNVTGYNGDYIGDYLVGFGSNTANLNDSSQSSVRAINDTTGSNSTNGTDVNTTTEVINEIQNDGVIDNILELAAITGQNEAQMNTGDGVITTGDANVAATLVNLLNTTVINGNLWVTVADIFGDLTGNIIIPELSAWLATYAPGLVVDATNSNTGSDSTNTVNVDATHTETTDVANDADIDTTINATAITGQNDSLSNTGGADITTGNAEVAAGSVSLANTTIEGGNWGIFIVNALNGWLGFMVGDNGQVQALSQEETLQHIEAQNNATGAGSENTVDVTHDTTHADTITNTAEINNLINASAITGQNDASLNTGAGVITTGNAGIQATTVNLANTTVKNGSLFIAVVNVLGDWFGELMYDGSLLASQAAGSGAGGAAVTVNAGNETTGSDSTNEVQVDYTRDHTTTIDNDADIVTTLNATVDTGSNNANKNTGAAQIDTGDGLLALHSRSVANLVGIADLAGGLGVEVTGANDTTGADSENRINANVNDNRVITVNNEANVSTVLGTANSPILVNTGDNAADMNTLGAVIVTGSASADIAIQNVVNQVILALAGRGVTVDADFINTLTGALSTNTADLTVAQSTLVDIVNHGLIDNLINLLLNTGGNSTNLNTGEVAIVTGGGCVDATIVNDVNHVDGAKSGVKGGATVAATGTNDTTGYESTNTTKTSVDQTGAATVDNDGQITNDANIAATTGDNQQNMNTNGAAETGTQPGECEKKVAVVPTPTPQPSEAPAPTTTPAPSGGGETPGGNGGGDDKGDEKAKPAGGGENPRVAGVTKESQPKIAPAKKGILTRFPVAGGEQVARLFPGQKRLPWQLFIIASMLVLGAAWSQDRKVRARHLGQLP